MLDIFMITKKRSSDYKVKIKMQNKCDNCGNQIREDEEVYIIQYHDSFGINEICGLCSDRDTEKFSVVCLDPI